MEPTEDATLELIELFKQRREKGLETYGVPVNPDSQDIEFWLKSKIEENADAVVYGFAALKCVQKLRQRIQQLELEVASYKATLLGEPITREE